MAHMSGYTYLLLFLYFIFLFGCVYDLSNDMKYVQSGTGNDANEDPGNLNTGNSTAIGESEVVLDPYDSDTPPPLPD